MSQIPASRGIRICEKIIVEESTRNYSLINCYSHRILTQAQAEFFVHAALADGLGEMRVELFISRPEDNERLYRREGKINLVDRLQEYRLTIRVRDFAFPAAGRYQIGVLIDGELVDQTILSIDFKGT